ncbi:hypothetical protein SDC9_191491 [bioreactor metagenome]|uniref:Uncharacterized protein n=1 Tax=bioreactor metagenome TaxID=1076179 RepID=A0A645HYG5_9ZZZZ
MRRYAPRSLFDQFTAFGNKSIQPADARTDINAEPVRIPYLKRAVLHCLRSRRKRKLHEKVGFSQIALFHIQQWIEVLDLGGDFYLKIGRIKPRDIIDPAAPCDQTLPKLLQRISNWGYDPHACNNYSFHRCFLQ